MITFRQKKCLRYLGGGLCLLGVTILGAYNWKTNSHFWEASAVNCITIGIALVVSYYLVQRQNNRRKQKEILLDLIYKLQTQFANSDMYDLSELSISELTMRNRAIGNRIHILELKKTEFGLKDEVDFVKEHFEEYCTFIGNHLENKEYLRQSKLELKRPLDLIDGKLTEMAMKLFG